MEKEMVNMPERKMIDHRGPMRVDVRGAWYFITVCAEERCNYGGTTALPNIIGHWKHYVAEHYGLRFQRDFWDTRLRDAAHYAEKFDYVCRNPVRKGLVATPRDWPYVIAFDRESAEERLHK